MEGLEHALKVLEFERILERLAAECETALGRGAALSLRPETDLGLIRVGVERLGEAVMLLEAGLPSLVGVHDLRESVTLAGKGGVLEGETLARLAATLGRAKEMRAALEGKSPSAPRFARLAERLPQVPKLLAKLTKCIEQDGTVSDAASVALANARARRVSLSQEALEKIQRYVSGSSRALLSDPIYTTRSGRFVLPLRAEHKGKIRGVVHDVSASGATIYVEPNDVLDVGNKIREAEAQEREEIRKVLTELSEWVGNEKGELLSGLEALGQVDVSLAKGRSVAAFSGCVPELSEAGATLDLETARHPLLDRSVAVPFDVRLDRETRLLLVTGPNTGGKTVMMKAMGLAVAMMQSGLPVCASRARMGRFSQIWADIGDEQSMSQSLSTFSAHIKNIGEAFRGLKADALVLLDEVGAGTDPDEGAALARGILVALMERGALVAATTHYGELKLLATQVAGVLNASMEFDRKSLKPTYRLLVGVPGSSHALEIAQRYGIPEDVVVRSRETLDPESQVLAQTIARLEQAEKQARRAQSEADRLSGRLRETERELELRVREAEEARAKARTRAADEVDAVLRSVRREADEIFKQLKKDASGQGLQEARARLKQTEQKARKRLEGHRPAPLKSVERAPAVVTKGVAVRVLGLGQTGMVLDEPRGGQVNVQVGAIRMSVALTKLEVIPAEPVRTPKASGPSAVTAAARVQSELMLRRMRAEDALEALDRFLDDAILGGLPSVRIVHGRGEGVLRQVTHDFLRRHSGVKRYQLAQEDSGGDGVTLVDLK